MPEYFRLADQSLVAFIATSSPDRAKHFYLDILGLAMVSDELPFALVFDAHGTMLRITVVDQVSPRPYTVLGWEVPDIASAANTLANNGVRFERYQGMEQDELGVWSSPGGARVAWFKDPDGNTLSLSQH